MTLPLFDDAELGVASTGAESTRVKPTGVASTAEPVDTAALRKARGAFFTPDALCDYIAEWAIRSPEDSVLEPSCGEAAFLVAASRRLDRLGAAGVTQLHGVELHEASSRFADALVRSTGRSADIQTADFFAVRPQRRHAAVIGNPPYVRYQDFSGDNRVRARAAALAAGVPLTGLASSWAAFTVHAAEFLAPGGRLGLVLPAELLTVNYAAEVRRYLMQRFGRVRLVLFTERVFPGVQEEVVLLLAEDADAPGGTTHCELRQVRNAAELSAEDHTPTTIADGYRWSPRPTHGKWTQALLPEDALRAYTAVQDDRLFTTLDRWGDTTLGMVTGNNRYFALSPARAMELDIPQRELLPLSPPGSRHLRGLSLAKSAWTELGAANAATWLFRPPVALSDCSPAARAYIRHGEQTGVDNAYKCRVRTPWWRVPLVAAPDLFLTYMNADTPRLTTNRARVHHLNSVHGVYLRAGRKAIGADLLPLASLNTMTLLGAETVGRSYGGGMLKLEPKEADLLPVPSPEVLASCREELTALRPQMAVALRSGRLSDAARLVDAVLLIGALGMSRRQVKLLEQAHHDLTARRMSRARSRRTDAPITALILPPGLSRSRARAEVARVDVLLTAALKSLPSKPDDRAAASVKKRYSEKMSEVVAQALAEELRQRGMPEARPAPPGQVGLSGAERRLAGGIGAKKVDVTWATEESGLLLALSVKTINFRDARSGNFQKNLTNRRADMLIEAVTLHRRFPYAVLCGLLFLDAGAGQDGTLSRRSTALNAHQRLRLFTGRTDPAGRDEQFERLYLILVDANPFTPTYTVHEVGQSESPVDLADALDAVVDLVAERNFDFYEAIDGSVHKLSSRAARGEPADDSDVADVLVDLDDHADDE